MPEQQGRHISNYHPRQSTVSALSSVLAKYSFSTKFSLEKKILIGCMLCVYYAILLCVCCVFLVFNQHYRLHSDYTPAKHTLVYSGCKTDCMIHGVLKIWYVFHHPNNMTGCIWHVRWMQMKQFLKFLT
jgi:hypothetical protein